MFTVKEIGHVERNGTDIVIRVKEEFRAGLRELGSFSHVIVLWWANQPIEDADEAQTLQCMPPYAPDVLTGVFACRSPFRPTPVMMSVCPVVRCDETSGEVTVTEIDAFDRSPVIDLKAYFPVCDRVRDARYPQWLNEWPDWMPDQGIGIM